jgi:lysophospholipid hydrolase
MNLNMRTVAVLPAHHDVPIVEFADRLKDALFSIGENAIVLDGGSVTKVLGKHAFSRIGKLKLLNWLTEQEEKARVILYTVDTSALSPWALRSIRQVIWQLIFCFHGS